MIGFEAKKIFWLENDLVGFQKNGKMTSKVSIKTQIYQCLFEKYKVRYFL